MSKKAGTSAWLPSMKIQSNARPAAAKKRSEGLRTKADAVGEAEPGEQGRGRRRGADPRPGPVGGIDVDDVDGGQMAAAGMVQRRGDMERRGAGMGADLERRGRREGGGDLEQGAAIGIGVASGRATEPA